MESLQLPLTEAQQGTPLHPALSGCTDNCCANDHVGLESLQLHLTRELQGSDCREALLRELITAVPVVALELVVYGLRPFWAGLLGSGRSLYFVMSR